MIDNLLEERKQTRIQNPPSYDAELLDEYRKVFKIDCLYENMTNKNLKVLDNMHQENISKIPLEEIEKQILDIILSEACLEGANFDERNRL